ncbi:unnamed protein product [Orchesella dallaii]|uniref:Gustatory receptor n=1 Tax=Orchesella dallaii TaxID=48710 RepID=A0ABP1RB37_9HEXA
MEESAVTPRLIQSFKLTQLVYKYWVPYFGKYDTSSNKIQLRLEKNKWKLIPWFALQFFIFFLGFLMCLYYPLREALSPVKTISSAVISFSIWFAAVGMLEMSIVGIIWNNLWEFQQAFNRFIDVEIELANEIRQILQDREEMRVEIAQPENDDDDNERDGNWAEIQDAFKVNLTVTKVLESLMCLGPVSCSFLAIWISLGIILSDLDVTWIFLDGNILPHPYYQQPIHIILSLAVRIFTVFIWLFELFRFVVFMLLILITVAIVSNSIFSKLQQGPLPELRILSRYMQVRILFNAIEDVMRISVLVALVCMQIITSMLITFSIESWKSDVNFLISLNLSWYAVAVLVVTTGIILFIINGVTMIHQFLAVKKTKISVTDLRQRAPSAVRFATSNDENRRQRQLQQRIYRAWIAQRPINIVVGSLFVFKRGTLVSYLYTLQKNVCDLTLLIDL